MKIVAMKLSFLFLFLTFSVWGTTKVAPDAYSFISHSDQLKLQRQDQVSAEHISKILKQMGKESLGLDLVQKSLKEVERSKHFQPFISWLQSIKEILKIQSARDMIVHCKQQIQKTEQVPLEKILTRIASNYCRERTLEAIAKEIEKTNTISDDAIDFIDENLKFYLTKKNKKHFAQFIQSQVTKPDIIKKLSQNVTTYSVRHDIVPSQEVLKDMLINEEITKLIQEKGFNVIQSKNIFYGEFGKLIEQSYKSLENNPSSDKVKEQLSFLKNYLDLNQDHLPVDLCLGRLNDFSKAVFRAKFHDLSRDILKYVIKKNNKEIQEDALYFYIWTYISQGDYKEALTVAKKYDLISNRAKIIDARLKFWIGNIFEELNETKEALKFYEDIIQSNPLSFYSIMSVKKVQVLKPDSQVVNFYHSTALKSGTTPIIDLQQLDQDYLSSLIRLKAWSTIDSQRLMKLELKRLRLHNMPRYIVNISSDKQIQAKSDLHLLHAKIILDSENFLPTFRYLYEVLDKKEIVFNRSLLEILYPDPYLKDLTALLKKENLDPLIVLSLIRQESVFNPNARSPVGARGLMQIMPSTAKRVKRGTKEKQLANPKLNLEIGTKYFKGLMKRYDENLVYVLAAYNAGEGRVDRWRGTLFDSDQSILKNIESIPFLETRNYVKLIFRNIFFYKLLQEKKELTDPSEPNKIYDVKLGFKH